MVRPGQQRLPIAHEAAEGWNAVGFRSAATSPPLRLDAIPRFDYDSSSPDTDPFEPQNGGCCTWLPFFNGKLVELPLTLRQDHTLFVILGDRDEAAWLDEGRVLAHAGGMATIDTHPDYLIDERIFSAYARFLERFADDPTAWHALPREINFWWRRRAESWLEHDGSAWRVVGPAADEGRVAVRGGHLVNRAATRDITTRARAFLHIGPDHTVTSPAKPQQACSNRRWRARGASEGCPLSQRASWQAGRAASRYT